MNLYIHTLEYDTVADYEKQKIFEALASGYCRGSALGRRQRSPSTSTFEGEASNFESEKSDDEIPIVVKKAKISGLRSIKRPRTMNPAYNSIPNEALFSTMTVKKPI